MRSGGAPLRHTRRSVTPAAPSHPPLRHTRLSVTPACPSFLRRQESMRPVGGQGHSQCSTAPDHPPVRHSCGGRNPCGLWGVKGTPNARRRPITRLSVIPAEAGIHAAVGGQGHSQCSTAPDHPPVRHSCCGGSRALPMLDGARSPACPSFLRRQESMRPVGGQGHSQCSTAPDHPPVRHSCGGRNPCGLGGSRALPMLDGARSPACPSFLRRQESMRPVGGQGHSQCSTVPDHPPVRHSCGGRNPCGLWGVKGTPNARRRPITRLSVIPAEAGIHAACGGVKGTPNARRRPITRLSVIPAEAGIHAACGGNARRCPITRLSVIPAEAGIGGGCGGSRPLPMLDGARSPACPHHSCGGRNWGGLWGVKATRQCSTAPDHPPVRHSCGGRNPCGLWGVKATPNARRRPITRLSVIPAEAGMTERGRNWGGRASRRPEATRMTRQTSSAVAWEGDRGFGHGYRDGLSGGPGLGAVQSSFQLQTGIEAHAD